MRLMLTSIKAGEYTIHGVSIGGVYTCIAVPELRVLLDIGLPRRSLPANFQLFLSHGHVDHSGGLAGHLGIRSLMNAGKPLRVFMPVEIADQVRAVLDAVTALQRFPLPVDIVAMEPGQVEKLRGDLWVRAFRTLHRVPSLGYQFFRRTKKLRPEFLDLPGDEIARRRRAGDDLFDRIERLELAYATDTLSEVLDREPGLLDSRILILECTFLDQRKSLQGAQAGGHIHLDELLERASSFANEHLVLMHFSQIYRPREVIELVRRRCGNRFRPRVVALVPDSDDRR